MWEVGGDRARAPCHGEVLEEHVGVARAVVALQMFFVVFVPVILQSFFVLHAHRR